MSDLYRIERFGPDSERRFSAADAWMVDFEEGFAVVPVVPVGTLIVKQDGTAGFHKVLPKGKYAIVLLEAEDA